MTDKEKLNTILRLRLFYSTEKELGDRVGLSLKGNHFSRQKPFVCEAFFSKFTEECKEYTQGEVNLERLLSQYETTSKYFKRYIENTRHQTDKHFIPYLLNYLYMGEASKDDSQPLRNVILCEHYDTYNKGGEMNVGILILMTYGLIPTFKNKSSQDIVDIIADYKKVYDILQEIAQSHQSGASTKYKEMLCLKEMRKLIEEEQEGDNYLNRLLLIYITNDVLKKVFALEKPAKLRQYSKKAVPIDFELPRLWRCEEDADNIVWEFVPLNVDAYYLYRNEIDYNNRMIRFTRYQLTFTDIGYRDCCYTIIIRPSFNWHNLLQRVQPEDSISFDYTDIGYEDDKHTVNVLTFMQESPVGEKQMSIKAIKKQEMLDYYSRYLDHEGVAIDFKDVDNQAQYAIAIDTMEVAVTNTAILFKGADGVYKLDKLDEDGNETVPGICSLMHTDNFIYAELEEDGKQRRFLCLDSINQNLDFDELCTKSYFYKLNQVTEVF